MLKPLRWSRQEPRVLELRSRGKFYLIVRRILMHVIEITQKKRDNTPLLKAEVNFLINNFLSKKIANYQMSAFLMATCINGMSDEEISWLTDAMLYSGVVVSHGDTPGIFID